MERIICSNCKHEYSYLSKIWNCQRCSSPLNIIYSKRRFNRDLIIKETYSIWRYKNFLPPLRNIISLGEGWTPLIKHTHRDTNLLFKLEYLMPSGSFKDRGTSVAISRALDLGVDHVIEDSSGNAGISLSIYAAKAGVKADIYVPKDIPKGKLKILEAAEANIFLSNNRKKAYENAVKASKNGFYIGHLWNPFYIEGFKTLVYEVWEQLGGLFPDHIFVPVGSGSNLLGIYYGLEDLLDVGYIDEIPSLIAVEAAGYDIIHKELFGDSGLPRTELADGLRVLFKPRKRELLEIIRTYGHAMVVDETEIMEAYKSLWRLGFTVEPTSSVVYAAFKKAYESGDIRGDDIVLLPLTGNGIKMII